MIVAAEGAVCPRGPNGGARRAGQARCDGNGHAPRIGKGNGYGGSLSRRYSFCGDAPAFLRVRVMGRARKAAISPGRGRTVVGDVWQGLIQAIQLIIGGDAALQEVVGTHLSGIGRCSVVQCDLGIPLGALKG